MIKGARDTRTSYQFSLERWIRAGVVLIAASAFSASSHALPPSPAGGPHPENGPEGSSWPMYLRSASHTARTAALGPQSNEVNFTTNLFGSVRASPVTGADGTVYVGTDAGRFYAVGKTGTVKWSTQLIGPVRAAAA